MYAATDVPWITTSHSGKKLSQQSPHKIDLDSFLSLMHAIAHRNYTGACICKSRLSASVCSPMSFPSGRKAAADLLSPRGR